MISKFLLLNKTHSISSFKFIFPLKKEFKKVGHSGTLDPFATGLLVVALGHATKFIQFLPTDKKYLFSIEFGLRTDSDDLDGSVIDRNNLIPTKDAILSVLPNFVGNIVQTPSKFSAIKINGQRAYDLVRAGVDFEIPSRSIIIESLDLLSFDSNIASFYVSCSKGTYIRSLSFDICSALGVLGCIVRLHRIGSNGFSLSSNDCEEVDLNCFFNFYPSLVLSCENILKLKNGIRLSCGVVAGIYCLTDENSIFVGLANVFDGHVKSLCLL